MISTMSCFTTGQKKTVTIVPGAKDAELSTDMVLVLAVDEDNPYWGWWSSLNDIISRDFEVVMGGTCNVIINFSCGTQFPGLLMGKTAGDQKIEF